jgi:hypothetical protein
MTKTASHITYTGNSQEAGSACYRCQQPGPSPENSPVTIRAAVFFDGTLNNRKNTEEGEKGIIKGESYKNALTNIAIMERYYEQNRDYDHSFSIYVEGIGTEDDKTDSINGMAFGQGPTGILGKVEIGIERLLDEINNRLAKGQPIESLYLDCFGFSRGAAAARNFIHSAIFRTENSLIHQLQSNRHVVWETKIKFVGLYDTVASHGLLSCNDTEDLQLDAIKYAEYVVQLAAADEHRKHYPLTNIKSASHGVQLFLPGAHSDIGGGYVDNMDEVNHQIMLVCHPHGNAGLNAAAEKAALIRERKWLLESGWYREDEIQEADQWDEVKVIRRRICNHFHRIPLKMMTELAKTKGVHFSPSIIKDYPISSYLQETEALIRVSPLSSAKYWLELRTENLKKLRHDYLHFSACFGSLLGCDQPQFKDDDIINGSRNREVLDG